MSKPPVCKQARAGFFAIESRPLTATVLSLLMSQNVGTIALATLNVEHCPLRSVRRCSLGRHLALELRQRKWLTLG